MRVEIRGDKELVNKLQKLRLTEVKKAFRKGSRQAAKAVQKATLAKVPVRTGQLKGTIKVRALPRSRRFVGAQVTIKNDQIYYGSFVDLGTKFQKGQKFLQDAFADQKAASLDTITSALQEGIRNVR